jgi:hypothetical protein
MAAAGSDYEDDSEESSDPDRGSGTGAGPIRRSKKDEFEVVTFNPEWLEIGSRIPRSFRSRRFRMADTWRQVAGLVQSSSPAFKLSAVRTNPKLAFIAFAKTNDRVGIRYIIDNLKEIFISNPGFEIPWAEASSAAYNNDYAELGRELDERRILLPEDQQERLLTIIMITYPFTFEDWQGFDIDDPEFQEEFGQELDIINRLSFRGKRRYLSLEFFERLWNIGYDINTVVPATNPAVFPLNVNLLKYISTFGNRHRIAASMWLLKHGSRILALDNLVEDCFHTMIMNFYAARNLRSRIPSSRPFDSNKAFEELKRNIEFFLAHGASNHVSRKSFDTIEILLTRDQKDWLRSINLEIRAFFR